MTRVLCSNDDCIHCDVKTSHCNKGCILVSEGYFGGCSEYYHYLDTKEYNEEFYVLVGKRRKPQGREKRFGKKIEYNGRVFYSQEKVRDDMTCVVTDAKTGLAVKLYQIKENWEKFIELADKQPDIETFPVVVKGDDGEYHVVEEGKDDGSER